MKDHSQEYESMRRELKVAKKEYNKVVVENNEMVHTLQKLINRINKKLNDRIQHNRNS